MTSVDLWCSVEDPAEVRTFAAECSPIFTLYTRGLQSSAQKILATVSWTRIFIVAPGPDETSCAYPQIKDKEPPDNYGFGESVGALVDTSILNAPAQYKPLKYLDWLHAIMLSLARLRGWDETALENARRF